MELLEPEPRVVRYASCDYIRLTYTSGSAEEVALPWYQQAVAYIGERWGARPGDTRPWSWKGYQGAITGSAAWGLRQDGAILQVSGAPAEWASVLDLPYTGVPRIDIQVTTWGQASPGDIPRAAASASDRARVGTTGRPWQVHLWDGHGDGDTAYLGARTSKWFVRIYDKYAQSKEEQYKGAVRYEVEAHDEEAVAVYERCKARSWGEASLAGFVAGYLGLRGVGSAEWLQGEVLAPGRRPVPETPTARTLEWLRTGVAPTVSRLLGEGLTEGQLRAILGLG